MELISNLPLKEMEASLLTHAILDFGNNHSHGGNRNTVEEAMRVAAYLHRSQTRKNRGNMPQTHYIEHPLRTTVRLMRYGVTLADILVASILHDTLEDHPFDLATDLGGIQVNDIWEARIGGLQYLEHAFGKQAMSIINGVSNIPLEGKKTKDEKRDIYVRHVEEVIVDPMVFLVKFSDWVDNGAGLRHQDTPGNEQMVAHLAKKYTAAGIVLQERFSFNKDFTALISEDGHSMMNNHLREGITSLLEIIDVS